MIKAKVHFGFGITGVWQTVNKTIKPKEVLAPKKLHFDIKRLF